MGERPWQMHVSISEIADAVFPSSVREDARFLTVFTTYLDASHEDGGDSKAYSLAGFISDKDRWATFDKEWQGVLDKFEVDGPFHMTDYESGYGAFKEWGVKDPRKVPLIQELIQVIGAHVVASAGYGVSQEMYDAIVPQRVNKFIGGSPYFLMFLGLVMEVERLMDNAAKLAANVPYDWQMVYVLARGDPGSGTIITEWNAEASLPTQVETRTAGVFLARDNWIPPLQAADILAFEGRKQTGLHMRHHSRDTRKSFMALEDLRLPRAWRFIQYEHTLKTLVGSIEKAMPPETS